MTRRDRATVRNLASFTVVVLASGWIGWGLDARVGTQGATGPGMLLWLVTPLIASLGLRAFAGDGWKDLGILPRFRGNGMWYAFAVLVFPVMTLIILSIGSVLGLVTAPQLQGGSIAGLLPAVALGFGVQFLKNVFEEVPWRGYLAPKVHSLGLNDFAGHALVGIVWGAWHIPYYLHFLDRATLARFTTLDVAVYIPLAIWVMISWAVVYGEIRLLTDSLWPAVLMHTVEGLAHPAHRRGPHPDRPRSRLADLADAWPADVLPLHRLRCGPAAPPHP